MSDASAERKTVGPKMIVGLGNPGSKYVGTRHNIGFEVLERLRQQFGDVPRAKFEGQYCKGVYRERHVLLVWPLTFMNASGRCVAPMAKFFGIDVLQDLLVVCDDFSLPLGKLRMKQKGSSGGQKGLDDILRSLGTQTIARLRIGIEPPPPEWDVADYVLSRFRNDQRLSAEHSVEQAASAVQMWCEHGIDYCMNRIN